MGNNINKKKGKERDACRAIASEKLQLSNGLILLPFCWASPWPSPEERDSWSIKSSHDQRQSFSDTIALHAKTTTSSVKNQKLIPSDQEKTRFCFFPKPNPKTPNRQIQIFHYQYFQSQNTE
jgi:hypothetical protein